MPLMQWPSPPLECLTSNTVQIHLHSTQVALHQDISSLVLT